MTDDPINDVIQALDTFQPSVDDVEDQARLYEVFRDFRTLSGRERAMPAMFSLLERFPDADYFGSPGPLVHELEAILDGDRRHAHMPLLRDSVRRRPTYYTVWMVNRLLNSALSGEQRESWLAELRAALAHPLASEGTRQAVEGYLDHQARRSG